MFSTRTPRLNFRASTISDFGCIEKKIVLISNPSPNIVRRNTYNTYGRQRHKSHRDNKLGKCESDDGTNLSIRVGKCKVVAPPSTPPDRETIASALVSASAPQGAKREDVASRHASVWSRQLGCAPRLTMTTRRSCRVTKGPRSLARECPRLRARRRGQKKSLRCQVRAKGQRQQGWERGRRRGPSHPCHAPSESRHGRRGLRGRPHRCQQTASGRQWCGLRMRGGWGGGSIEQPSSAHAGS